jgi:glycosyltransferase involved in cell wall biosynthesis
VDSEWAARSQHEGVKLNIECENSRISIIEGMHLLHICSDYSNQKLYAKLVKQLSRQVESQTVYTAVRTESLVGRNSISGYDGITCYWSDILNPIHRVFFRRKIRLVYGDLLKNVDIDRISVVHAHFLFSDGAVALRLFENHGINYVVTVRNTDLNVFMRYRPDLKMLALKIMRNAKAITFLSAAYLDQMLSRFSHDKYELLSKASVIPNGLSNDWLEDYSCKDARKPGCIRLLYVGGFSKNKNVINLLRAVECISRELDVKLTLVGGFGNGHGAVNTCLSSERFSFATYIGRVENERDLRAIYREHDIFVMPSLKETFGVVYIEALSQGLPVVHSKGQGPDGCFNNTMVSESADPRSIASISEAILKLVSRLPTIRPMCQAEAKRFSWERISGLYAEKYHMCERAMYEKN